MRTSVTRSRKIEAFVQGHYKDMTIREMAESLEASQGAIKYWLDKHRLDREVKQEPPVTRKKVARDPFIFDVDALPGGQTWIV